MKDRPILFSGPMVRAILEGRKTQTRRIVKPQPELQLKSARWMRCADEQHALFTQHDGELCGQMASTRKCPYGKPGDRLWVRETWAPFIRGDGGRGWVDLVRYRADGAERQVDDHEDLDRISEKGYHWRPSIHMPRWASRITLEVVGVRVERLQDISEEDAKAEGPQMDGRYWGDNPGCFDHRPAFQSLWESINGLGSWNANPWVWVVEFKPVDQ